MGFFSGLLQAGAILALDTFVALLNGPKPKKAADLKNKSFASDAYGTNWPRCRGTVRLPGKVLWMSPIRTTIRKTTSGGIFGIGQQSVYYNLYSLSMFVGFGKKLGGGPAVKCLRIWADDKLLFNSIVSNALLSGSVTVNGAQLNGVQSLSITLGSGASFTVSAGDLISVSGDQTAYEVQIPITATGPATISVPIWPPLNQGTAGGEAVSLPGLSAAPFDLSSFDPDPHDGSHAAGGYNCPPGGVRFYNGTSNQQPDPEIVTILGTGNAPGYTGIAGIHIHDLQLRNYGDHPPNITAEWAFDTANGQFPQVGPMANMVFDHSDEPVIIALPFTGMASSQKRNPLALGTTNGSPPYVWAFDPTGEDATHDGTIFRVNRITNKLEDSTLLPRVGTLRLNAFSADNDGYLYFLQNTGQTLTKMDGTTLSVVQQIASGLTLTAGISCFDVVPSLFGNPIKNAAKFMVIAGGASGNFTVWDRTVLLPYGVAVPGGPENVVTGYDSNGNPQISAGNRSVMSLLSTGIGSQILSLCNDLNGDLWAVQGGNAFLQKFDAQFQSSILFDSNGLPQQYLGTPSFSRTDIDISSITANPKSVIYYFTTIIVSGNDGKSGKVDIATNAIVANVSNGTNGATLSPAVDVMGGVIMGDTLTGWNRMDAQTLQFTANYGDLSQFFPPGTPFAGFGGGYAAYDQITDSLFLDVDNNGGSYGGFNRVFLDRANGQGISLAAVFSSAIDELNAKYGFAVQYDVSLIIAAGLTVYGVEFDRESYADSLRHLMQLYLIDAAPIDGKIWFIPRGQASVISIPESDLGALSDPSSYEPRIVETLQDPQDIPESVWIAYYDPLKQDQQAKQYAKRISKPYASTLSAGKNVTNSRQQLDLSVPVTENATPIRQQAEKILWDAWAGRRVCKFKLPPKYQRLTPSDVLIVNYKGNDITLRIEEIDLGAGDAIEVTARTQDSSVYSSTYLPSGSSGSGGSIGNSVPPVAPTPLNYTISPAIALSQASATEVDMLAVVATWSDLRTTKYAARSGGSGLTVTDPGAGNSQLYYVTIYDPNRTGEPSGSPTLTAFCDVTPQAVHLGEAGYVFIGTITITHDTIGVIITSGGSQNVAQAEGFYVNGGGGSQFATQIDVLTYLVNSQRSTKHLTGIAANSQAANIYSYLDPTTHSIAQIKSASGWAADIQLYFTDYVKQFITELDDPGYRLWSDPASYKKYQTPLLMMPRYITPGVNPSDIVNSGSNPFNRYTACGLIDTINRGVVTCRNYLVSSMNFDSQGAGGGNLGDIPVLVHERYAGNSRERMYWGLNLGFVKWDAASLVSGSQITGVYKVTNWAVHNKLVAGGGVSPSFSCGYGVGWP